MTESRTETEPPAVSGDRSSSASIEWVEGVTGVLCAGPQVIFWDMHLYHMRYLHIYPLHILFLVYLCFVENKKIGDVMDYDLKDMREAAGISQKQMAKYLEKTQGQISRMEKSPDDVSRKDGREWERVCGKVEKQRGVDVGDPLARLKDKADLVGRYLETAPEVPESELLDQVPNSVKEFTEGLNRIIRKPVISVFGQYNQGKSTFLNATLGIDKIPASYQPTTRIIVIFRHVDDKPKFHTEQVWTYTRGLNCNLLDDEQNCVGHKVVAGGFDTLEEYGTHSGEHADSDVVYATCYLDSPVLRAATFIDHPGFAHDDRDDRLVYEGAPAYDAMIYFSMSTQYMPAPDIPYMKGNTAKLPDLGGENRNANLMIVCGRADLVGEELDSVMVAASRRLAKEIPGSFVLDENNNVEAAIYKCMTPYSLEDLRYKKQFDGKLEALISEVFPSIKSKQADTYVESSKLDLKGGAEKWWSYFKAQHEEQDECKKLLAALEEGEAARLDDVAISRQAVSLKVQEYKERSVHEVENLCAITLTAQNVEQVIRNRYSTKKESEALACGYFVGHLEDGLGGILEPMVGDVKNLVDDHISQYDELTADLGVDLELAFDARSAFVGGLAGLGTLGAISAWAIAVAAGSNLGGYVAVAKIASLLSAVGITMTGGSATLISVVASMGGPLAVAIGVSLVVAALVGLVSRKSWQQKHAESVIKTLSKHRVRTRISETVSQYWDDTLIAFERGADATEHSYQEYVKTLKKIAEADNLEELEKLSIYTESLRDFFGSIPWSKES